MDKSSILEFNNNRECFRCTERIIEKRSPKTDSQCKLSDGAVLCDSPLVVRITGVGKGGIGQSEDDSSVANPMTVNHPILHTQRKDAAAGAHRFDIHAHVLCGIVQIVHRLCRCIRKCL